MHSSSRVDGATEIRSLDTMAAVVVSRKRPPLVELAKDSLRQGCSGFKWHVPERDLVLGLGFQALRLKRRTNAPSEM